MRAQGLFGIAVVQGSDRNSPAVLETKTPDPNVIGQNEKNHTLIGLDRTGQNRAEPDIHNMPSADTAKY